MTPQSQIISDPEKGDCFRACIASLLNMDINDVPNFIELGRKWFIGHENCVDEFLQRNGYDYLGRQMKGRRAIELSKGVDGYYIASVKSVNYIEKTHSVIFKGTVLVHDPSLLKKWSGTIDDVRHMLMIERSKNEH